MWWMISTSDVPRPIHAEVRAEILQPGGLSLRLGVRCGRAPARGRWSCCARSGSSSCLSSYLPHGPPWSQSGTHCPRMQWLFCTHVMWRSVFSGCALWYVVLLLAPQFILAPRPLASLRSQLLVVRPFHCFAVVSARFPLCLLRRGLHLAVSAAAAAASLSFFALHG